MDEKLIAIVDDDQDMIDMVTLNLKDEGFRVKGLSRASELFKFLEKEIPDLIILDLMLPERNGLEICKDLKNNERYCSIPVIMLSGEGEETVKVTGLDLGSDDYLVKPCSFNELRARIEAVLRRHGKKEKKIAIGDKILIDSGKFEVLVEGKKVNLTSTEFKILLCLATRKGQVFSRERILEYLWAGEKVVVDRTIDVHVRHLREKLGPASSHITNVRGLGYKLEEEI